MGKGDLGRGPNVSILMSPQISQCTEHLYIWYIYGKSLDKNSGQIEFSELVLVITNRIVFSFGFQQICQIRTEVNYMYFVITITKHLINATGFIFDNETKSLKLVFVRHSGTEIKHCISFGSRYR